MKFSVQQFKRSCTCKLLNIWLTSNGPQYSVKKIMKLEFFGIIHTSILHCVLNTSKVSRNSVHWLKKFALTNCSILVHYSIYGLRLSSKGPKFSENNNIRISLYYAHSHIALCPKYPKRSTLFFVIHTCNGHGEND